MEVCRPEPDPGLYTCRPEPDPGLCTCRPGLDPGPVALEIPGQARDGNGVQAREDNGVQARGDNYPASGGPADAD